MLASRALGLVVRYYSAVQTFLGVEPDPATVFPSLAFSDEWQVLGPFQIGTRELAWGADPLEALGGFHALQYNESATFKSSLGFNGTIGWSKHHAEVSQPSVFHAEAALSVRFPKDEWAFLQDVYGWTALQWQGWARGCLFVRANEVKEVVFRMENVMEYWIDDKYYFGGDDHGYDRSLVTLRLEPGAHSIDVRLARDVRAFGGIGDPSVDVKLGVARVYPASEPIVAEEVLISDVVGGKFGLLASPYASVNVRNDFVTDIYINGIDGMRNQCELELLSPAPIRLVAGQSRPIGFRIACILPYKRRLDIELNYRIAASDGNRTMYFDASPRILNSIYMPHKLTFVHPGGMVSYAMLRPPSERAQAICTGRETFPVLIALHGANVEADSDEVKHSLDSLSDLCAWVVFPTGVTAWSSDDWHTWGFADAEAAVDAIPDWIEKMEWKGPIPDTDGWIVVGHSNGGQGAWYALTHKPDRIIAAAPLSGYSSIQTYIPYNFRQIADPGREAVVQAALLSFRHEMLLRNVKDIPIYQQHGSEDDNVPAYHSRLLSQRIEQVGAESIYQEMPGKPHWWDGVMTTQPLSDFLRQHTQYNKTGKPRVPGKPRHLTEFSLLVANPGETGSKFGTTINQLMVPGRLGKLEFTFDDSTQTCILTVENVMQFTLPRPFSECRFLWIDGQQLETSSLKREEHSKVVMGSDGWFVQDAQREMLAPFFGREPSQQGGIEAILRTRGTFQIYSHSPSAAPIALQVSRNLFQYFAADTNIATTYENALTASGNIISLVIGSDLPPNANENFAINTTGSMVYVQDGAGIKRYRDNGQGLAAIYVRPPQNYGDRLELVIWGKDEASLAVAARLVPMMTGTGVPDFVVTDRKMLWQGLDGVRALGFFDYFWQVSRNSFL